MKRKSRLQKVERLAVKTVVVSITQRSRVQIPPPQLNNKRRPCGRLLLFVFDGGVGFERRKDARQACLALRRCLDQTEWLARFESKENPRPRNRKRTTGDKSPVVLFIEPL